MYILIISLGCLSILFFYLGWQAEKKSVEQIFDALANMWPNPLWAFLLLVKRWKLSPVAVELTRWAFNEERRTKAERILDVACQVELRYRGVI